MERNDPETRDLILHAELRKAEDTLRAYSMSILSPNIDPYFLVHRFFYDRVKTGKRIEDFYGESVVIDKQLIPFSVFTAAPIIVNNKTYPSINELLNQTQTILCPQVCRELTMFGLRDCHGGNVMIGKTVKSNNNREILYIEMTDFHSLMLDMTKPLYNDVYFNIFYADVLGTHPRHYSFI